jgi:hypothetical protein
MKVSQAKAKLEISPQELARKVDVGGSSTKPSCLFIVHWTALASRRSAPVSWHIL